KARRGHARNRHPRRRADPRCRPPRGERARPALASSCHVRDGGRQVSVTLDYDPVLSRVRVTAADLGTPDPTLTAVFERSTNGITWTRVRGGTRPFHASTIRPVDDYEFAPNRSEEHTSEPSHVKISYAVFCLKKKTNSRK